MLVFGALGLAMARLGWPRPPLLLGLVLGPLAENRLFLSTDNYGAAWLLRPGVLLLARDRPRRPRGPARARLARRARRRQGRERADAPRHLRLDGATAFSLAVVLLFVWALWQSRELRRGAPDSFPGR